MDPTLTSHLAPAKVTFTTKEKELLVSLLKNEKIIEDKCTNKSTNKLKAEAWDRITKRYNNHPFVTKRKAIQLRRCLEKIKRITKDAQSKEKITRMATGEGSPSLPNSDYVPGVDEDAPHLINDIPNTEDSDTLFKIERQTGTYKTQSDLDHKILDLDTQNSQNSKLTSKTASDVVSMRHINIIKERRQQQELYLMHHSVLEMEKEQLAENIRHQKEINILREIMETEKLEHQRALQKIEIECALSSKK